MRRHGLVNPICTRSAGCRPARLFPRRRIRARLARWGTSGAYTWLPPLPIASITRRLKPALLTPPTQFAAIAVISLPDSPWLTRLPAGGNRGSRQIRAFACCQNRLRWTSFRPPQCQQPHSVMVTHRILIPLFQVRALVRLLCAILAAPV